MFTNQQNCVNEIIPQMMKTESQLLTSTQMVIHAAKQTNMHEVASVVHRNLSPVTQQTSKNTFLLFLQNVFL